MIISLEFKTFIKKYLIYDFHIISFINQRIKNPFKIECFKIIFLIKKY